MTDVRTLIDEHDIRAPLEGYARAADRGDTAAKVAMYHDGGYDDHGFFRGLGKDWATRPMPDQFGPLWRLFGNVRIDLDGDVAYTEHYVLMVAAEPPGIPDPNHIIPTTYR